jgi:type II secretion system protein I
MMSKRGFTLFEVLMALGVFAVAVTGLALALQSAVDAALNARARMLARTIIESRLAAAMADPPMNGRREIDPRSNSGISVLETFEQTEIRNADGTILPGMWKLVVTAGPLPSGGKERAEIMIYKP